MFYRKVMMAMVLSMASVHTLVGQEKWYRLGVDYTTELQTDFRKKVNWVNLLSLEMKYIPWRSGAFTLQTMSTWKSRKDRIIGDLQVFSNIEEENMAVSISQMGYAHTLGSISLFAGVRNVNTDYFTGNYTSLFTNSSCGIYPTLSANYPMANYPVSAMCVHAEFRINAALIFQNSLYNGVARKLLSGERTPLVIDPKRDGIINVAELSYLTTASIYGRYTIGSVYQVRGKADSEINQPNEAVAPKKLNYAFWGSVERYVSRIGRSRVGVLLQGSFSPLGFNDCSYYYGAGMLFDQVIPSRRNNELGLFYNQAAFAEHKEHAVELTWKCNLKRFLTLQPAFHYIQTGRMAKVVGMMRVGCRI